MPRASKPFRHGRLSHAVDAPLVELKFHVGDVVHEVGDSELGKIEFIRRDGFACIVWASGTREWLSQDVLCGPLLQ